MNHESDLTNHGFSEEDIVRLRASSAKTATEMDTLLNDLANRFKALIWVLSVMLLIFVAHFWLARGCIPFPSAWLFLFLALCLRLPCL